MQGGQIGVLFSEVRRGKALAQLMESAKITDASGNVVDLSELDEDDDAEEIDDEAVAIAEEDAFQAQVEAADADKEEAELAAADAEAEGTTKA
jgi:trigger factor